MFGYFGAVFVTNIQEDKISILTGFGAFKYRRLIDIFFLIKLLIMHFFFKKKSKISPIGYIFLKKCENSPDRVYFSRNIVYMLAFYLRKPSI